LRPHGHKLPIDTLVLVDTGADITTLPYTLIAPLGFSLNSLESITTNAVGGIVSSRKAPNPPGVAIEIGGVWYDLPALNFVENTPALLGRDLIFKYFKLRMETGETELRAL